MKIHLSYCWFPSFMCYPEVAKKFIMSSCSLSITIPLSRSSILVWFCGGKNPKYYCYKFLNILEYKEISCGDIPNISMTANLNQEWFNRTLEGDCWIWSRMLNFLLMLNVARKVHLTCTWCCLSFARKTFKDSKIQSLFKSKK